jgi:heme-degrading monooxygenase HmoA
MAVRVLIERKVLPENQLALDHLLMKLRRKAMQARGYISGETLHSLDDPNEYLVISTWNDLEAWKKWENDQERQDIQTKIDSLLSEPSIQRVYIYG